MADTAASRSNTRTRPLKTRSILEAAWEDQPLLLAEAQHLLELSEPADLEALRETADAVRRRQAGEKDFFYRESGSLFLTNRCELRPALYPYYDQPQGAVGSVWTIDDIDARIERLRAKRCRRLYVSHGGYSPQLPIAGLAEGPPLKTLARLLRYFCDHAPELRLAGFSPDEIDFLSIISDRDPRYILEMLSDHGLTELGGQGVEILSDVVRRRISEKKASVARWLEIAAVCCRINLPLLASIEMGPLETPRQRALHLERMRRFISEHPGAFRLVQPRMWPRLPAAFAGEGATPSACRTIDRFKMTAVLRLFLGVHVRDQALCWSPDTRRAEAEEALSWGANGPGDTDAMDYPLFLSGEAAPGVREGGLATADFLEIIANVGGTPVALV